jgi:hypothetical protein
MVANQASNAARTLGLDAANRRDISHISRQRADTLTYKSYADCLETKVFLGWDTRKAWWYCSGMQAGGKFRVTAANRWR